MDPAVIDPSLPDPFGHAGYRGIIERSSERAALAESLAKAGLEIDEAGIRPCDVAYYRFANGWGAGVLLGTPASPACSVATPDEPFEMAVLHGRGRVCYASSFAGGTVCPLDAAGVRAVLDTIAAMEKRTGCRHQRV